MARCHIESDHVNNQGRSRSGPTRLFVSDPWVGYFEMKTVFSVIVPTYNRPRQLLDCLTALAGQDYPARQYQVVVVDDGGFLPLDDILIPFQDRLDLTLIRQNRAGPAAARNRGAQSAQGRFLAFTDDDCAPAPDWLRRLGDKFNRFPRAALGGQTINALSENPFSTAGQALLDYVYSRYNSQPEQARFLTSNNLAVPSELFEKNGGFSTDFFPASEDRDFCARWLAQGHRMVHVPDALVFHAHHLSLGAFLKQHYGYGRGACLFHQKHGHGPDSGPVGSKAGYYAGLLVSAAARQDTRRPGLIQTLIVLSQLASAMGMLRQSLIQSSGSKS